jgi:ubiquinone/menaquinone biosynthesis C-methylase UbiE
MLARVLEPEVMDSAEDAREYDSMDHAAVNAAFVADFVGAVADRRGPHTFLDLGVGTAQIPIALCRALPEVRVVAIDAAESMLAMAHQNVAAANLEGQIELVLADAKALPFPSQSFNAVISNTIVHHIAEPAAVLAEAKRVGTPHGRQFHRDLCRPRNEAELDHLVATYARDVTPYQRKLFADSLRAALTLEEIGALVEVLGSKRDRVQMTSDRHWTWIG